MSLIYHVRTRPVPVEDRYVVADENLRWRMERVESITYRNDLELYRVVVKC